MKKGVLAGGLLLGLGLLALLMARIIPLPERLSAPPSSMVLFEDGRRAHLALAPDDRWRVAVSLDEIDPAYLKALLHLEDKRFWYHPGVDPVAIARAVVSNITQGRVVSGASTLTMQLVRMVERRPRTLRSKAIEALRALQLEVHFSKAEILEKYLQFLPFGKNVEGIEAASLAYFSHRANALSSHEIALLLAVPQAPTARHPSVQNQGRLLKARNEILEDLVAGGVFLKGEAELEAAKAQAIPQSMAHFPRDLPHGAQWFFAERGQSTPRIHTTLDGDIQKSAVEQLRRHQKRLNRGGIYNGSVVVVDHQSMEIKALVGNFDFWDEKNGGQINGFATARSVGSTMKPFIYALAIDERLALPDHLLPDIPLSYGAYQPENYDGQYAGLVRLDDALSRSLNLPFIELLRRLKVEVFLGKLQEMGAQTLVKKPGYYGLSLAAGALALSPIEVATFYAVLARGGAYKSLRIYRDSPWEPELRIFSAGAAELTRRALSLRDRPDFPIRSHIGGKIPGIHWKTGTSFGHRDAWSVGSNGRYTVAVWLGNFDNRGTRELVGSEAAGPILFDILESLPGGPSLRQNEALRPVEICAYSGRLPTPACPRLVQSWAPESGVPIERCAHHIRLDIDDETGLALTPLCRGGRNYHAETFVVLPPTIRRWLRTQSLIAPGPPSFMPDCEELEDGAPPKITSPRAGQVLRILPGLDPADQEIPLEVELGGVSQRVSWFVDGLFLGNFAADERAWWQPTVGVHRIVVTDEAGRSASRRLEVR